MAHAQRVVSTTYPYLRIRVSLRGQEFEALALVDSGFTGDVVIPEGLAQFPVGSPDTWVDWEVADGAVIPAPLYYGTVEIIGFPPIPAAVTILGQEHLVGTGVIDHYRVTFDHGQRLIVEP
jgi:predicted aspartyl protease